MKTSAETIVKAGVDLAQRLFSRVMSVLCIPAPATITPQLALLSHKSRTKPAALLMAGAMLTLVSTAALLTPRTAEARPGYLDAVILLNHPTSAQAHMCSNCHTPNMGPGYANRIDYVIYNGLTTNAIPSTNAMYAMDSDQDGRTNLQEIEASKLAGTTRPAQFATGVSTGPNVANNWNWQIPDRDGDGCSHYLSRFTEAGTYPATAGVAAAAIVGTGDNYRRFNPRGWDMDDNDAAQGCNPTAWTDTAIDVTSGTSTDTLPPGAVNTLSGAAIGSAIIPLKWNAVGDDGNGVPGGTAGGPAHSYELRYTTTAFANGTVGRNPRSPADWEIMHNIAEPDEIDTGGFWSAVGDPDSLMQALYEPRPDVPGVFQPCNALNTTCTTGASYDIKSRGTHLIVNTIVDGTTYWVALWTHDGVTRITGDLTLPGTVTEQATLSNIIAVTAGPDGTGAAISSISPTTLSGAASIAVTATGFGLNKTQAAQMVLTNTAGTVIATATGLTHTATGVTGTFAPPLTDGTYNLELRTSGAVTKAAWVNAMTVSGTVTSVPVISNTPPNGNVGVPYSHQMTATGGSGSNVWSASGLPSGLSISSGGLISGTPNTAGTFVGTVTVTDANAGTDSDAISIVINSPPNVDLVMADVSTKSGSVRTGRSITVSHTVKNQGVAPTTSSTTVGIYLSTDATITAGDILIGNQTITSLAAGASLGASASMQVNVAPGNYYLGAVADKDNTQLETVETNNSLTAARILTVKP